HGVGTGLGVGAAVVGPAAAAHLAAGGSLAILPAGLAVLVAAALGTLATRLRLRWSFPRLAAVALVAQPALHRVFAAGHGAHPGNGGHQGHAAHGAPDHVEQTLGAAAG